MYIPDIIIKKRNGNVLNRDEINYMIDNYVKGDIADYQMAAFLMACFIRGLSDKETIHLTEAMLNSGDVYSFDYINGIKVDKHSTGGVGDKVSIPLAPILSSIGFYVPMVSGRGLGHTGGTLDKLESIKGFNVYLSKEQFKRLLEKNGIVMCGQTDTFVPADKKLYALRDVTGTVDSIPLITASIMSKKLAEGIDSLILDVKVGSGAFMKTIDDAEALAEKMYSIGKGFNKNISYIISDMSNVLGDTAGNGIEIYESMEILKGNLKNEVYTLTKELAAILMLKNKVENSKQKAYGRIDAVIDKGYAYEKFEKMIKSQNGDLNYLKKEKLISSKEIDVISEKSGYINNIDAYKIGVSLIHLKAGRNKKEDKINHLTGIRAYKKIGDRIEKGERLFTIYYDNEYEKSKELLMESVLIGEERGNAVELIKKIRI